MDISTAIAAWALGTAIILWLGITLDLLLVMGTAPITLCYVCQAEPADWDMRCLSCLEEDEDDSCF